ncbi:galactofuranosylgalactofuranosylrhamnosyl-N-acetylglucosaminyl-diphospho-decaprenol beta-1,5/1,6-galactofuranosyltransferase [Arthrobacter ulcerisalmonis]|nr:glycosyltransferase [Arthrobacter ulcerisalmonis]MDQ0663737.1 galactofuranosylgalactofuranosylrhamnosyl-N-acetylglucosaminyl-diphospho-decaprenol beta-1,5/1,6-galactofuranosyltransferase [Arthrobacter ulcerisalmonis]
MSLATEAPGEERSIVVTGEWQTVHRVVLPTDGDADTLPLYVDFNAAQRVSDDSESKAGSNLPAVATAGTNIRTDFLDNRRQLHLPAYRRVSFGTYFNAFPASYWRAHTDVSGVRLTVDVDAPATVVIYRSTARGTSNRVESISVDAGTPADVVLPLANFGDGGWYWFDLIAGSETVELTGAEWSVRKPEGFVPGTATVAVTTFNRPDYCVKHLTTFAESSELLEVVDRLLITDQGTQKVRDQDGYAEAAARLGDKFAIIEQGNLGGSGGFARGMHETVEDGRSKYVLLLDDDVIIETEGVLRAINFADFTRKPTIVGGHMFNLYERSVMHTFGEEINEYKFFWGAVESTREGHDFSASNLRTTPWMHRRIDVDFNGWWMCLVPTSIVREIGLSLPVFIKWDDAEYGIRARRHGYQTVTLPGAAVWHMPWTEKDDTIDWQAYFHQRNRWLAALVYSPYKKGGILPRMSFMVDVKHLLSMQYSAVELRLDALEDLLKGPSHLHETIKTKLPEIRARRAEFDDARITKEVSGFPQVKRVKPPRRGKKPTAPKSILNALATAATAGIRQVQGVRPGALEHPEALVPAMDARWWRLSQLDSAIVSSADGSGAAWYKRQPEQFRTMMARSLKLHQQLLRDWDKLSKVYAEALPQFTSPEAWKQTFDAMTEKPAEQTPEQK